MTNKIKTPDDTTLLLKILCELEEIKRIFKGSEKKIEILCKRPRSPIEP